MLHSHVTLEMDIRRQIQVPVAELAEKRPFFSVGHFLMPFQVMILGEPSRALVALVRQQARLKRCKKEQVAVVELRGTIPYHRWVCASSE